MSSDTDTPIAVLIEAIAQFRRDRNWGVYHTPQNLAQSVSIEAAELLELYQWGQQPDPADLRDELADVIIYCLNLADVAGIDVTGAVQGKIAKNAVKYPPAVK